MKRESSYRNMEQSEHLKMWQERPCFWGATMVTGTTQNGGDKEGNELFDVKMNGGEHGITLNLVRNRNCE